MAAMVHQVLNHLQVTHCAMIGHSMGGYVALEFAAMFPEMLTGLSLFHSTASEDSPEARLNRDRAIAVVKQNHVGFIRQFIPDLFAPENREKYDQEISVLQERAVRMKSESITAAMEARTMLATRQEELREARRNDVSQARYEASLVRTDRPSCDGSAAIDRVNPQ
jgi:pimeloyl-ACP methyl ester carboxylesterase